MSERRESAEREGKKRTERRGGRVAPSSPTPLPSPLVARNRLALALALLHYSPSCRWWSIPSLSSSVGEEQRSDCCCCPRRRGSEEAGPHRCFFFSFLSFRGRRKVKRRRRKKFSLASLFFPSSIHFFSLFLQRETLSLSSSSAPLTVLEIPLVDALATSSSIKRERERKKPLLA